MPLDISDNTAIEIGLDIKNYPGKWKQAKKMAFSMDKRDYQEENAFKCACRLFLELGGEKIEKSADQFLFKLAKSGGRIVSSNDLTVFDIAFARAEGRMFVDNDGFGYVYLPKSNVVPFTK